jgi:hypothetical protein
VTTLDQFFHDRRAKRAGASRDEHLSCHAWNLTVRSQVYLRTP